MFTPGAGNYPSPRNKASIYLETANLAEAIGSATGLSSICDNQYALEERVFAEICFTCLFSP